MTKLTKTINKELKGLISFDDLKKGDFFYSKKGGIINEFKVTMIGERMGSRGIVGIKILEKSVNRITYIYPVDSDRVLYFAVIRDENNEWIDIYSDKKLLE